VDVLGPLAGEKLLASGFHIEPLDGRAENSCAIRRRIA
jgi:hypothetical protein